MKALGLSARTMNRVIRMTDSNPDDRIVSLTEPAIQCCVLLLLSTQLSATIDA